MGWAFQHIFPHFRHFSQCHHTDSVFHGWEKGPVYTGTWIVKVLMDSISVLCFTYFRQSTRKWDEINRACSQTPRNSLDYKATLHVNLYGFLLRAHSPTSGWHLQTASEAVFCIPEGSPLMISSPRPRFSTLMTKPIVIFQLFGRNPACTYFLLPSSYRLFTIERKLPLIPDIPFERPGFHLRGKGPVFVDLCVVCRKQSGFVLIAPRCKHN